MFSEVLNLTEPVGINNEHGALFLTLRRAISVLFLQLKEHLFKGRYLIEE